ncbi:single-stranded-DNA-specific exonuclease RecJ [Candidatus Uhrbacteria bacterium CG10_big_fil_rev_8_21_14_0_10_50_16]|uniref:Single-stranded-DNA-specific exonuclease RecJ n=1 Tax=Candidatus Uhrbacteria bacterium CG10_big_fil_rev_8_21_14_0_10_50_16 TaxID=1975039 RepID=A0A2H0RMY3_9BACT|nr:MAG: single-stranded-DNA-specific exonuclease RecJ [Candidatus Uhrbacteria bacterium CG10_big_fil_rev_8_21_14_0_10_50_16]
MKKQTATWNLHTPVEEDALRQFPELDPVLMQLLWNRGIRSQEEIYAFFNPDYGTDLHDPFLFRQMKSVVKRIYQALEKGETIVIHGDYDADGICGTAVLVTAIKEICRRTGIKAFEEERVRWYLPSREGDGYGMSYAAVETFKEMEVNLIITVDCGIANVDEIALAYAFGMEVIVVDHHQLPQTCSELALTVHPLVPGETYPFKKLAAVGVAFKVACALYAHGRSRKAPIPLGLEKWLLDLVSIATVTDMVPLTGENRLLETYGLMVLNKSKRVGLLALMNAAGLTQGKLTTTDIGFRIGPRLNAAGRIAKADVALELMLEEDESRADALAEQLNQINTERQKLTEQSTKRALEMVDTEAAFIAVVDHETRVGVAGLVAGKLAQQLGKPSVVMTRVGVHVVGSGRAPSGFQFVQAMDTCRELMVGGGGHPEACGFTLLEPQISAWVKAMNIFAAEHATDDAGKTILDVDAELELSDVTWELVERVSAMEPHGMGNPTPTFLASGVQVIAAETVGKTQSHLRLSVATSTRSIRSCIGFGWGWLAEDLTMGDTIDLVYEIGVNEWNGNREIQLQIVDIQKVS